MKPPKDIIQRVELFKKHVFPPLCICSDTIIVIPLKYVETNTLKGCFRINGKDINYDYYKTCWRYRINTNKYYAPGYSVPVKSIISIKHIITIFKTIWQRNVKKNQ